MTQEERIVRLIAMLLEERGEQAGPGDFGDEKSRRELLRALFNTRPPWPASPAFLELQDAFLQEERNRRGVTSAASIPFVRDRLCLWQGDITLLDCDAVVNAANSAMLGCFHPGHHCIDNAIQTFAGVQLRLFCARMMEEQGHPERTGGAKITPAFNLPSRHVIHTVGPIVNGPPSAEDERLLASCYSSCLALAAQNGVETLAFCCISTGVFGFPQKEAADIAVRTVAERLGEYPSIRKVVFNVFRNSDLEIYRRLLG